MTNKAATEGELGDLHKAVAKIMSLTVRNLYKSQELFDEALEAAKGDPTAVMDIIVTRPEVSPAFLAAVTKFLADNKITCQVEDSKELSDTQKIIAEKQKRRVGNVIPMHDAG